jgi:predicted transcriptional regulator of viral defense system
MQPMTQLLRNLRALPGSGEHLFCLADLRALLPRHGDGAFKSIIARLEKRGDLTRVCRGVYMLADSRLRGSALLGRTAALLRASYFNYLSLESVLSDAGVISQVPVARLTLMSSGRSNTIYCGHYGCIEFVHTCKKAAEVAPALSYDPQLCLWRANVGLALRDMRDTRRDTGLVNWEGVDEFV